jgi:hypothetical protein
VALTVTAIALCLVFIAAPTVGNSFQAKIEGAGGIQNQVCPCPPQTRASSPRPISPVPRTQPISSSAYDEQIGLTFTQDFKSLVFNVTAVEQTDPILGDGPAYLLSGISNLGSWYQVGVSWDWTPGANPGEGFNMNYEVYDNMGNSVFPSNGQGGLTDFTGSVNAGDTISLDLYFSNSNQSVTMLAEDSNTGAVASETYPSMGATYFVGLPDSVSDPNGYFTGLMTEWYHGAPYYANEAEVVYSNHEVALSSAWMWMDEYSQNAPQPVFSTNTSAPVSFGNPTRLLEFSYNGTTEYGDGYEFVTGSLAGVTQVPPGVPLTLSFTVKGGSGYSAPALTYVSNGTSVRTPMSGSPTIYVADPGSSWSFSLTLNGTASGQRWETSQSTSGVASTSRTVQVVYYDQRHVVFGYLVSGGGSGYSPPTIRYSSFGAPSTATADNGVWADAGSGYQYQSVLSGSNQSERWYSKQGGYIGSSGSVNATYYLQYVVTFDISFKNTGVLPGIPLSSTSLGKPYSATMVPGANDEWLDQGSDYSVPLSISQGTGNRLITNGTGIGKVAVNLVVGLVYEHQFYINIAQNAPSAGTVSPSTGWYDSGSELQMDAIAAPGWLFEGWIGVGVDSESGSSATLSLAVGPAVAANETAVFYPGVTIYATGPVSISYSDGSVTGSVSAGGMTEVYVPPSSTIGLTASSFSFLTTFSGWTGASNSSNTGTSFVVEGPVAVASSSQYNYFGIVIIVAFVALVAAVTTLALTRRHSKGHSQTAV